MNPVPSNSQRIFYLKLFRYLVWSAVILSVMTAALTRVADTRVQVWDDAYMFVRYADNILSHNMIAWNFSDGPKYGATSLLYLGIMAISRSIFPDNPLSAAFTSSLVCGIAFLILIIILLEVSIKEKPWIKLACATLTLIGISWGSHSLAIHFESGMETTFVMAYLTLLILLSKLWVQRMAPFIMVIMILCAGFSYFVRPDLTLYATGIPFFIALFQINGPIGRQAAAVFISTIILIFLQIKLAAIYFGNPLPLPFYVKTLGIYSEKIYRALRFQPIDQLWNYVQISWLFILTTLIGLVAALRGRAFADLGLEAGLVESTLAFIFYYLFLVLQVMPFESRFYFPTYGAIIYLSAKGLVLAADVSAKDSLLLSKPGVKSFLVVILILTTGLAIMKTYKDFFFICTRISKSTNIHMNFDPMLEYRVRWKDYWVGLDKVSKLPDDLVLAATEVGRLAALNPKKKIVDISGLNNRPIAMLGFSGQSFFRLHAPDLIYMPHKNYESILAQILRSRVFRNDYILYTPKSLGSTLGVAVKKNAKYTQELLSIFNERAERLRAGHRQLSN